MTAIELNAQNTQLWQNIGAIADSAPLMERLSRYVAKLVKEKNDPTLMSKEEFFKRVDEAKQGPIYQLKPGESLDDLINRVVS